MRQYAEEGRGRFGVRGRVLPNVGLCFILLGAAHASIFLAAAAQAQMEPTYTVDRIEEPGAQ